MSANTMNWENGPGPTVPTAEDEPMNDIPGAQSAAFDQGGLPMSGRTHSSNRFGQRPPPPSQAGQQKFLPLLDLPKVNKRLLGSPDSSGGPSTSHEPLPSIADILDHLPELSSPFGNTLAKPGVQHSNSGGSVQGHSGGSAQNNSGDNVQHNSGGSVQHNHGGSVHQNSGGGHQNNGGSGMQQTNNGGGVQQTNHDGTANSSPPAGPSNDGLNSSQASHFEHGLREYTNWQDDVEGDLDRAMTRLVNLAFDDHAQDGRFSIEEHYSNRLDAAMERQRVPFVYLHEAKSTITTLMHQRAKLSSMLEVIITEVVAHRQEVVDAVRTLLHEINDGEGDDDDDDDDDDGRLYAGLFDKDE